MKHQFYAKSILLLLLLVPFSLASQDKPNLIWGKPIESLKGYEINQVFGADDDVFYVFRQNKRKKYPYALQKISTDSLTVLGERIFSLSELKGNEPKIIQTLNIGRKLYFIATTTESAIDSVNIYAYEILDKPNIEATPTLLARVNRKALNTERDFTIFKDDGNELFTLILPQETEPQKNEKFELLLFNSLLEMVNSKIIELPYPSNVLEYTDALVDSSGAIYVLASIINPSLSALNKDRNIGRNFSLFKYGWETETLVEKSLSLGSKWLYDVRLFLNKNNNIQVAGYYSNMVDLIMAGTFSLELDKTTGKILNQGLNPFDREFRTKFRPKGGNISETELGMFNLDYVFPAADGGTQFISEKNYTETSTVFNPGTGTYSIITVYNYDEILLTTINESSKIKYNIMIPKFQSSTSLYDSYTSYIAFSESDKTFFIYNDNDRNRDLGVDASSGYRQLTSAASTVAVLVVVHKNGETVKIPLYTSSKEKPVLNTNFFYQTRDGVVLLTNSGYDSQFVKLKLRE
ncbi:hypothetical protein G3O08_19940 [Cryomorpha ignava]|uniref:Uncharacterized protein n=1 Tax=Cryomorpha ignava TaxID=101383 RepID=A0A7K3WW69_9FLAO|nr:hypothetical protein [Cryomorpha ignava]NEN25766.1 hypothetical protein [Cryomorpha ignava]